MSCFLSKLFLVEPFFFTSKATTNVAIFCSIKRTSEEFDVDFEIKNFIQYTKFPTTNPIHLFENKNNLYFIINTDYFDVILKHDDYKKYKIGMKNLNNVWVEINHFSLGLLYFSQQKQYRFLGTFMTNNGRQIKNDIICLLDSVINYFFDGLLKTKISLKYKMQKDKPNSYIFDKHIKFNLIKFFDNNVNKIDFKTSFSKEIDYDLRMKIYMFYLFVKNIFLTN